MPKVIRLTCAQAIIRFLKEQYVERDAVENRFFAGCFGIFGHGNLAGIGEALQENLDFRYYQCRNEQAMGHIATAFAKMKNRKETFVCTTSIGPGATNMITAAAGATINRLPLLMLLGDIFARRNVAPVLQQLESEFTQDISVNDAFKAVSRYWDRINRPEQILTALPEIMRILTSPADTGATTLCLPQDVQTEAYDYPLSFFDKRVWPIARIRPDKNLLQQAADLICRSRRPLIIAGGGAIYSEALDILQDLVSATGIPLVETHAGKGSLSFDHPLNMGAMGATGTLAANRLAKKCDLVIGIGTRYSDFTTASKTAFQNDDVRFININVTTFDAFKHYALPLVGDAKATLQELLPMLKDFQITKEYRLEAESLHQEWEKEVQRIYDIRHTPLPSQGELIGAINEEGDPEAIIVCAAGSLPGDLHKLWRSRHTKQYQMEYGYSCMGYEIAGGLGVKMAAPEREVYVLVGDASYLMLSSEIITSIQEGYKLTIFLFNNHGYKSIGALSRACGSAGFGTRSLYPQNNRLPDDETKKGNTLPIDFIANAKSLGADTFHCQTYDEFMAALKKSKKIDKTTVIVIENDRYQSVAGYDSWWDVPVAEISQRDEVNTVREKWQKMRVKERFFFPPKTSKNR